MPSPSSIRATKASSLSLHWVTYSFLRYGRESLPKSQEAEGSPASERTCWTISGTERSWKMRLPIRVARP